MDANSTSAIATVAKAIGWIVAAAFLLVALLTGAWLLLFGAVIVGLGMMWVGASGKRPNAHP